MGFLRTRGGPVLLLPLLLPVLETANQRTLYGLPRELPFATEYVLVLLALAGVLGRSWGKSPTAVSVLGALGCVLLSISTPAPISGSSGIRVGNR